METDRDRAQPPIGVIDPRDPPNVRRAMARGPDTWSLVRRLGASAPAGMRPFGLITRLDAMLHRFAARGVAPAWDLAAEAPDPVELRLAAWDEPGDDAFPTRWERRREPTGRRTAPAPATAPGPAPAPAPAPASAPAPAAKPRPAKAAGERAREKPTAGAVPSGRDAPPAAASPRTSPGTKPPGKASPGRDAAVRAVPAGEVTGERPGNAPGAHRLPGPGSAGRPGPVRPRPSSRRFVSGPPDAPVGAPDSRMPAPALREAPPVGTAPRTGPGGGPRPARGAGRAPLLPPALMARVLLAFPEAAFAPRTTAGADRGAARDIVGIGAASRPPIATPEARARPAPIASSPPFDPNAPDGGRAPRTGRPGRDATAGRLARRATASAVPTEGRATDGSARAGGGAPAVLPIARRAAPLDRMERPVLALAPVDAPALETQVGPSGRVGPDAAAGTARPRPDDAARSPKTTVPVPAPVRPGGAPDPVPAGPMSATRVARKPVAAGSLTLGVHVPPIGREPPAPASTERAAARRSGAPVPGGRFADARTLPMALLSTGRPGDPGEAAGTDDTATRIRDARPAPGRNAGRSAGRARLSPEAPAGGTRPAKAGRADRLDDVARPDASRAPATSRPRGATARTDAEAAAPRRPGPLVASPVPPGPGTLPGQAPVAPGAPIPERAAPRRAWDPRVASPESMAPGDAPAWLAADAPPARTGGAGPRPAPEHGVLVAAGTATTRAVPATRLRAPGTDGRRGQRPATSSPTPYGATAKTPATSATAGSGTHGTHSSRRGARPGPGPDGPTILPMRAQAPWDPAAPGSPLVATRDGGAPRAASFTRFADAIEARVLAGNTREDAPLRDAGDVAGMEPARGRVRRGARAGGFPASAPIGDAPHALVAAAAGAWPRDSQDDLGSRAGGLRVRGGEGDRRPGVQPAPHARPAAATAPTLPGLPRPSTVTWTLAATAQGGGGAAPSAGLAGARTGPGDPSYRDGWPLVATSLAAVSMTARLATRESGPPSPASEPESPRESAESGGGIDLDSLAEEMASRILRRLKREKERRGVHA